MELGKVLALGGRIVFRGPITILLIQNDPPNIPAGVRRLRTGRFVECCFDEVEFRLYEDVEVAEDNGFSEDRCQKGVMWLFVVETGEMILIPEEIPQSAVVCYRSLP